MSGIRSILALGTYGLVGREIVPTLLAKTQLAVSASGRSAEKLEALAKRRPNAPRSTRRLDAYDVGALALG